MSIIEFKKDSIVFYKNEQYKIVHVINFNKVAIEHVESKDIINVSLNDLSSKLVNVKEKNYIDSYSDEEWSIANKRHEIIKDLVFKDRTKLLVENIAKQHGWSHFLVRGKTRVAGENALIMLTYNFRRLLNLIGITLFQKLIRAYKNGNIEDIKQEIAEYIAVLAFLKAFFRQKMSLYI